MPPRRQPARFRREVSATFTAICESGSSVIRDESCLLCGATPFASDRKWTSESTRSTRTSVRQLHPLDSERSRKGNSHSHATPTTLCRRSGQILVCSVLCNSSADLLVGTTSPRPPNAKWCKEWKSTEWSDVVLADLVRPTLEGLILAFVLR